MTPVNRETLLEGAVGPQLRSLAAPLALGIFMIMLVQMADAWFISHLGTRHLAAFGFTLPVIMTFMGVIYGFCIGTTSTLARVYGGGDFEQVRRLSTDALTLTALVVSLAAVAGYLMIDPLFTALGAGPDILPLVHDFMLVWYIGLPFMSILLVGNACIRASGDTRFPSKMMMLTSLMMIIIDPFLIFGWAGVPRMELTGAAMAMTIVNTAGALIALYAIGVRRKMLEGNIFHAGVLQSWKKILHVGIPSVFSNLIGPISAGVVTWMAAGFGNEAVAALGIANRIEGLAMLVPYSLNAGTAIFVGQNFGAGNYSRVREGVDAGARYCIIWGIGVAAILFAFANQIPALFDKNAEVIGYSAMYFHMVPLSFTMLGVMIVSNSCMNAMGRPLPAAFLIFMKGVGIYVPLAFFLKGQLGFAGIPLALMITNFTIGTLSYLWNRRIIP